MELPKVAEKKKELYLHKLKLSSFEPLDKANERRKCPKCDRSKKLYCPYCYVSLVDTSLIPQLTLPLHVSVLQHPKEKVERSSIIPAKVLAPSSLDIYRMASLPAIHLDPNDTLFLYPTETAKAIKDVDRDLLKNAKHLLMIDSTWAQVQTFLKLPEVKKLTAVKISAAETTFWRYQQVDSTNLATVEALYFFFKEYDEAMNGSEYDGKYDNLLYFYTYNYNIIQERYINEKKEFTRIPNYIKGEIVKPKEDQHKQ
eukprot:TRINITY_DN319_c0_g1_i11.p1 TRINITY_DN319_c0_g1~~TRINITY_DN319_c0_g1_i11.p1  ORF type:complete len:256 (-),score=86.80 TRINITY_DN319_c0_g1_i11:186-953(-)